MVNLTLFLFPPHQIISDPPGCQRTFSTAAEHTTIQSWNQFKLWRLWIGVQVERLGHENRTRMSCHEGKVQQSLEMHHNRDFKVYYVASNWWVELLWENPAHTNVNTQ